MDSYTITLNGKTQTIESDHNEEDFEKAVQIFMLFDDDFINKELDNIVKFDPNFKFRFYYDQLIECIFDTFMMVCFIGNTKLISKMYDSNVEKLNNFYCFGTNQHITPFSMIHSNFMEHKRLYEKVKLLGNFDSRDTFDEFLIPRNRDKLSRWKLKMSSQSFDKLCDYIDMINSENSNRSKTFLGIYGNNASSLIDDILKIEDIPAYIYIPGLHFTSLFEKCKIVIFKDPKDGDHHRIQEILTINKFVICNFENSSVESIPLEDEIRITII